MKRVPGRMSGAGVWWSVLLLVVLLLGTGKVLAADGGFTDAPPAGHWAAPAVTETGQDKLLIGYPDGSFRGDQAATRYELAMALSRLYRLVRGVMEQETANPRDLAQLAEEVKAVQGALTGLADRLATLESALEQTGQKVEERAAASAVDRAATEQEIKELANQVKAQLVEVEQRALGRQAEEKAAVTGLTDRLAALEKALEKTGQKVEEKAVASAADGAALEQAIKGLANQVGAQLAKAEQRALERRAEEKAAVTALAGRLDALESALEKALQEAAAAAGERGELEQKLAEHAAQIEGQLAEAERRSLDRRTKQEASLEMLRKQLAQTADQLAEALRELAQGRKTDESLLSQLADQRQEAEALENRLADLAKDGEALTKKAQVLDGRTGDLSQGLDSLQQRVETLESENLKLKEGLRRMGWLVALGAAALAVF